MRFKSLRPWIPVDSLGIALIEENVVAEVILRTIRLGELPKRAEAGQPRCLIHCASLFGTAALLARPVPSQHGSGFASGVKIPLSAMSRKPPLDLEHGVQAMTQLVVAIRLEISQG